MINCYIALYRATTIRNSFHIDEPQTTIISLVLSDEGLSQLQRRLVAETRAAKTDEGSLELLEGTFSQLQPAAPAAQDRISPIYHGK